MANPPPSSTVTFLFTDIEGSTSMWERDPVRMAVALVRHDEILRSNIEANEGYVFKTVGDAYCAAFSTAGEALAASFAAQRALFTERWDENATVRVRMALHTGVAEERDGDYFGPPVNRVARLLSAGHGGQVLLSGVTYGLVRDNLGSGLELRYLGEHRLKDLRHTERIFQLVARDLPEDFPPLKLLDAGSDELLGSLRHNLPHIRSSFVGREREIPEVKRLLATTRLLTLTGTGGKGKTRLALEAARDLVEAYPDGVWLVELAGLNDSMLVPQAVAKVLQVHEQPGCSLVDTLVEALRAQRMLLVLDNCEHLIDACARLVDMILTSCLHVQILATSREALDVVGEANWLVPSLSLPDVGPLPSVEGLTEY
jgi:class 3 adenylate cyclase